MEVQPCAGDLKKAYSSGVISIVLSCLAIGFARAEDLVTTDGKIFKDVTITKVEPDGLSITHQSGSAKVPFAKLPEEVQRKHGYDPAKADAFAKAQNQRRAELQAIMTAAREKELALERAKLSQAFAVTPESAEGISVTVQSRAQFQEEQAATWRMELYSEEEIKRMLAGSSPQALLRVTWHRPDYDGAASAHFRVIVSDAAGNVRSRTSLEYQAPRQAGEADYVNGDSVKLDQAPEEFRVRVVDGNLKVWADFTVRRAK